VGRYEPRPGDPVGTTTGPRRIDRLRGGRAGGETAWHRLLPAALRPVAAVAALSLLGACGMCQPGDAGEAPREGTPVAASERPAGGLDARARAEAGACPYRPGDLAVMPGPDWAQLFSDGGLEGVRCEGVGHLELPSGRLVHAELFADLHLVDREDDVWVPAGRHPVVVARGEGGLVAALVVIADEIPVGWEASRWGYGGRRVLADRAALDAHAGSARDAAAVVAGVDEGALTERGVAPVALGGEAAMMAFAPARGDAVSALWVGHGAGGEVAALALRLGEVDAGALQRRARAALAPREAPGGRLLPHAAQVIWMEASPDGRRLVTLDERGGVWHWDVADEALLGSAQAAGPLWLFHALADGFAVVDTEAVTVYAPSGAVRYQEAVPADHDRMATARDPQGRWVAAMRTRSPEPAIGVLDAEGGGVRWIPTPRGDVGFGNLAVSGDGRRIAYAAHEADDLSGKGLVMVQEIAGGEVVARLGARDFGLGDPGLHAPDFVGLDREGEVVFGATLDGLLIAVDLASRAPIWRATLGLNIEGYTLRLAVSPDGAWVGLEPGDGRLYRADAGTPWGGPAVSGAGGPRVTRSVGPRRALFGDWEARELRLVEVPSGALVARWPTPRPDVAAALDAERVAVVVEGGVAIVGGREAGR